MSFEKVLESAKLLGNDDFVKDLESAVAKTTESLTTTSERVKVLETTLEGEVTKKKKLRELIKANTGLEEISEDTFKGYIESLKGKGLDEAIKADNEKLTNMIGEYKSKLEETTTQYERSLNNVKLDNLILGEGALSGIESSVAKGLLLEKIREGAVPSDNGLVYKDENGSTVLKDDGTPLTLSDKVAELMDNPDYSMFFPDRRKKGGGKSVGDSSASSHGVKDLSKLTRTEKAKLMSELSAEDYQALVRANLNKGK